MQTNERDRLRWDVTDAAADLVDFETAAAPTDLAPGSEEKIALFRARYRFGLPLEVDGDRRDNTTPAGGVLGVFRGRMALTHRPRTTRADYSSGNEGEQR